MIPTLFNENDADARSFIADPNQLADYGVRTKNTKGVNPAMINGMSLTKVTTGNILEGDKVGTDGANYGKYQAGLSYSGTTIGGLTHLTELSNGQWLGVYINNTSSLYLYLFNRTDEGFTLVDSLYVTGQNSLTKAFVADLSSNKAVLAVNYSSQGRYYIVDYENDNLSIGAFTTFATGANYQRGNSGLGLIKWTNTKVLLCGGVNVWVMTYNFSNDTHTVGSPTQMPHDTDAAAGIDQNNFLKMHDNVFTASIRGDDNMNLVVLTLDPSDDSITTQHLTYYAYRSQNAKFMVKVGDICVLHAVRNYNGVTRHFYSYEITAAGVATQKSAFTDSIDQSAYEGDSVKGGCFIKGNLIKYVYQDGSYETYLNVNPDGTITLSEQVGTSFGTKKWVFDNNISYGFVTGSITDGSLILAGGLRDAFVGVNLYDALDTENIYVLVKGVNGYETGLTAGSYYALNSEGAFEVVPESYAGRKFYAVSDTELIL